MKLLAEISEGSLELSDQFEQLGHTYELGKSARAIVLNEKGEMATQYLATYDFHKLPGGGVEKGESNEAAVKREVLEEVGCQCEITKEIGVTIEYRNFENLLQVSYCFVAAVVGGIGPVALEPGEIEEGQKTLWLPPKVVLAKMEADRPKKKEGHFILKRESTFLKAYLS